MATLHEIYSTNVLIVIYEQCEMYRHSSPHSELSIPSRNQPQKYQTVPRNKSALGMRFGALRDAWRWYEMKYVWCAHLTVDALKKPASIVSQLHQQQRHHYGDTQFNTSLFFLRACAQHMHAHVAQWEALLLRGTRFTSSVGEPTIPNRIPYSLVPSKCFYPTIPLSFFDLFSTQTVFGHVGVYYPIVK